MSDLPFDIDDILNEINKRKEEIEREIDSASVNIEEAQSRATEQTAEAEPVEASAEPAPADPEPEEASVDEEPIEGPAEEPASESGEAHYDDEDVNASYLEDVDRIFAEVDAAVPAEEQVGEEVSEPAEDTEAEGEAVVMREAQKARAEKRRKKRKLLITVIVILVVALIGTGAFGFYYVDKILNDMTDETNLGDSVKTEEWSGMNELVVKFDDIYEDSYASSYRDMVKKWYYNGEPASSTNILNVLLIGEDTRGDEIMDEGTLADSVIIASVNIETGELILSSILRDTYAYYETVPGDESTGTYGKINSAMSKGGLSAYINAVERLFKINIDNYVLVNFSNFKKIIDTLGGVTIEMTAAEIREINNHPGTYGNVYIDGDAGTKLLTGEQALAYCRIRHIDSDDVRADRQKTVLLSVFSQLKNASMIKLTSVVTNLLPYVKTGFSKSEILSIGEYALAKGWLSYKLVTHTVPKNDTRADGTPITVCVGGQSSNFYNTWCWKVDFPLATQILQEKIYGKTNVVLAENRPSFSNLSAY